MANLTRSAKPASKWTPYELEAFNIEIHDVDAVTFFRGNTTPDTLCFPTMAPGLSETILNNVDQPAGCELSKVDRLFFQYLKAAEGYEASAVYDFTIFLLSLMDYDRGDEPLFRTQKDIPFYMGDLLVDAKANAALLTQNMGLFLLILHAFSKDQVLSNGILPEAQLIAESIAAFSYNHYVSDNLVEHQEIPGILMVGSAPIFYRTNVSVPLLNALVCSTFPEEKTVVLKYTPPTSNLQDYLYNGLRPLDKRRAVFQNLQAFKDIIDHAAEDVKCRRLNVQRNFRTM